MAFGQTGEKAGSSEEAGVAGPWVSPVRSPSSSPGANPLRPGGGGGLQAQAPQTLHIHVFLVWNLVRMVELEKYVYEIEIEQNLCLFRANDAYRAIALKY